MKTNGFRRIECNPEEARIWEAAFAAYMLREFAVGYPIAQTMGRIFPFDVACDTMSAEAAETFADNVVKRMREWQEGREV